MKKILINMTEKAIEIARKFAAEDGITLAALMENMFRSHPRTKKVCKEWEDRTIRGRKRKSSE